MPIVPPADMLPNPVFYPCYTCPKRGFLRQKSAEKMKKKAFSASKTPQNSPNRTHFKNMLNALIHKQITKNHPICHPLRLENYFSAIFVSIPPKKTPLKAPQTDPSNPPNSTLPTPYRADFGSHSTPQSRFLAITCS